MSSSFGYARINLLEDLQVNNLVATTLNINASTSSSNNYITNFTSGINSTTNVINYLQPNMSSNEQQNIVLGESTTTSNSGYLGFNYQTLGSTSNYLTLGIKGTGNILNVNGNSRVGINTTNPSFSLDVLGTINSNLNIFNTSTGVSAPTFTSRSIGTRNVIYPFLSATSVDYSQGINTNQLWTSIPQNSSTYSFKWYAGITNIMTLDGTGSLTTNNATINNSFLVNGGASANVIDVSATGSGSRALGLTIAGTPSSSFLPNTTITDANRLLTLTSNTTNTPIILTLRNLQQSNPSRIWDIINEGTGNSRLLFQSYNNGSPITPLTLDSTTGNVGISQVSPLYNLDVSGTLRTTGIVLNINTTNSISTGTGALQVFGGIGIGGNINIGGNVNIGANSGLYLTGSSSGTFNLKAPATITSYSLIVPTALPTVSGQVIISDTSGNLSFGRSFLTNTFTGTNNNSTQTAVSGLNYSSYSSFDVNILVKVIATTNLTSIYELKGILNGAGTWNLVQNFSGDNTLVQFYINSSGQLLYTSGNYTGFTSLLFSSVTNFAI